MRIIIIVVFALLSNFGFSQCDLSVQDIVKKINCDSLIAQCPILTAATWNYELCDVHTSGDVTSDNSNFNLTGNVFLGTGGASSAGVVGFYYSGSDAPITGIASIILPTVIGETYTFSYSVGRVGSGLGIPQILVSATADSGSGSLDNSQISLGTATPTAYSLSFTASSDLTEISFTDATTNTSSLDATVSLPNGIELISSGSMQVTTKFLRIFTDTDGVITSEDRILDGSSAYTPTGNVDQCDTEITTTEQTIYSEEYFAISTNGITQSNARNSTITRTGTGRWNVVFATSHPDGANYHPSITSYEDVVNRDARDIQVVEGSQTALGFSVLITTGDNGAGSDILVDTPWSFSVDAPIQILQSVTISN